METKHKHLTQDDRYKIKHGLDNGDSFKAIGRDIGKDNTTVAKEVKNRRGFEKTGCVGHRFNCCANRFGCDIKGLCADGECRGRKCQACAKIECSKLCPHFEMVTCAKLERAPYTCNGCDERNRCTLLKAFYKAVSAQNEYEAILRESREGFDIDDAEAARLDAIISPLLRKGQSLHHICVNNTDRIMRSERAIYNYVGASLFEARNIDMPRKVRFRKRKMKRARKVDRTCHVNRTYEDYLTFRKENPDVSVVEMDTVYGRQGGKCLLTLHFVNLHCMLMILLDELTARAVTSAFTALRHDLGTELFRKMFQVILTDRGTEFTDPKSIEFDENGEGLTHVFFCDPRQSQQKGAAENNHSMLRRVAPKGSSFDDFDQSDITIIMNHVNSYGRPSLNDRPPYRLFEEIYGIETMKKLGAELVPPDKIILHPKLLSK